MKQDQYDLNSLFIDYEKRYYLVLFMEGNFIAPIVFKAKEGKLLGTTICYVFSDFQILKDFYESLNLSNIFESNQDGKSEMVIVKYDIPTLINYIKLLNLNIDSICVDVDHSNAYLKI